MSDINIPVDQRKVAGVCTAALSLTTDKGFSNADIVVGLAEALARIVVSSTNNYQEAKQIIDQAHAHMRRTIAAGHNHQPSSLILPH